MSDKPFVSIIIPVKNFERTIEKTFEYLLNVDYPRDSWEWVIADGGANDKTIEIIKNWQKKYPFFLGISPSGKRWGRRQGNADILAMLGGVSLADCVRSPRLLDRK